MTTVAVLIATLIADQITKGLVVLTMSPGHSAPDGGFFRFTYVTNTGSAFGLFPHQTTFLIIASFVGIGALLVFYRTNRVDSSLLRFCLGLQLGGAIGNLVDRVRLGHVVDFIDVGAWPVFNLADSAIVLGLTGLMWTFIYTRHGRSHDPEPVEEIVPIPIALEMMPSEMGTDMLDGGFEAAPAADRGATGKREESWE